MKISAIIPCYNEELSIKQVIEDIKKCCPECHIYVFDNNSTDNSYIIAKETGVIVKKVMYQGKGEVVRQAFSIVDSDIYILIDGDNECDASAIPKLINIIKIVFLVLPLFFLTFFSALVAFFLTLIFGIFKITNSFISIFYTF